MRGGGMRAVDDRPEEELRLPRTPVPDDEDGDVRRKCDDERDSLSPRESADCAGLGLVEAFENEEDGGS